MEFVGEVQSDHAACNRVVNGEIQLVCISPESLLESRWYRDMLVSAYAEKLVAVIVDETHCVKTWGERLRQAFSRLD